MNKKDKSKMERQKRRLRDLIKEYSELGYTAYADILGLPMPETIEGIQPDLILKKGDKMIVMEIKSSEEMKKSGRELEQLAKYAEKRENVRFDIIISNPRPRLTEEEKLMSKEILLDDIQNRLLLEAKKSYTEGFYRESVICLTVLLENIIRQKAMEKKAIEMSERVPTNKLINILLDNRVISESNLKEMKKFMKIRNKVVHGGLEPTKQTIIELFNFIPFFIKSKDLKQHTFGDILLIKDD